MDQFFKFAVTGGLGTIVNLAIFFISVDIMGLPPVPVSIFCFIAVGVQNYIINHKWSFKQNNPAEPLSFKKYFMFMSGALLGLLVNISIMRFLIFQFVLPWKTIAQACGIAAGMIINFTVSKLFVFKKAGDKK
jgi:putative flippase GtrA